MFDASFQFMIESMLACAVGKDVVHANPEYNVNGHSFVASIDFLFLVDAPSTHLCTINRIIHSHPCFHRADSEFPWTTSHCRNLFGPLRRESMNVKDDVSFYSSLNPFTFWGGD